MDQQKNDALGLAWDEVAHPKVFFARKKIEPLLEKWLLFGHRFFLAKSQSNIIGNRIIGHEMLRLDIANPSPVLIPSNFFSSHSLPPQTCPLDLSLAGLSLLAASDEWA